MCARQQSIDCLSEKEQRGIAEWQVGLPLKKYYLPKMNALLYLYGGLLLYVFGFVAIYIFVLLMCKKWLMLHTDTYSHGDFSGAIYDAYIVQALMLSMMSIVGGSVSLRVSSLCKTMSIILCEGGFLYPIIQFISLRREEGRLVSLSIMSSNVRAIRWEEILGLRAGWLSLDITYQQKYSLLQTYSLQRGVQDYEELQEIVQGKVRGEWG